MRLVDRGAVAIGDRVAEGHDRLRIRLRIDEYAGEDGFGRHGARRLDRRVAHRVAVGDVGGVAPLPVRGRDRRDALEIEADREFAQRIDLEGDGVADPLGAGRNDDAGLAVEGDGVVRAGLDGAILAGKRDMRGRDRKRHRSVEVRQDKADLLTALANRGDLTKRLVPEISRNLYRHKKVGSPNRLGASGPRGDEVTSSVRGISGGAERDERGDGQAEFQHGVPSYATGKKLDE